MEITYTYKVLRVRKYHVIETVTDVISVVELSIYANSVDTKGAPIVVSDTIPVEVFTKEQILNTSDFTQFIDLTEEQVVEWALSIAGQPNGPIDAVKTSLRSRLEAMYEHQETSILPWNNVSMSGEVITITLPWDQVDTTPSEKAV